MSLYSTVDNASVKRRYTWYMENIQFGSIMIVGTIVSILVQWLKSKTWGNLTKKVFAVALSIAAAGFYIFFKDSAFWPTFIAILASASLAYTFIVKDLFPKE